jgi:hypothetical protein
MKTITKEYVALEVSDIEKAVSDYLGREVKISEIDCVLIRFASIDTYEPQGMFLEFNVGDETVDSYDLFFDDNYGVYLLNGVTLSISEDYLGLDEIFDFDIELFKSFETTCDASD